MPTEANGLQAVVCATAEFADGLILSDIGAASPETVPGGMTQYLLATATTRAMTRVLRSAMASFMLETER
jgi:hypothetical protein